MRPELRPYADQTWHSDARGPLGMERVLPTGSMHFVLRLSEEPLRLIVDGATTPVGHAIVGGARSVFYARQIGGAARSVGVMLKPGVARALFGASAAELAERHTPLELLWGSAAQSLLDRVASSPTPLATFEAELVRRLDSVRPFELPVGELPIATEKFRLTEPSGRVGHCELDFGVATLMVSEEYPELGILGPESIGGTSVTIHLHVDNADALIAQVARAGGTVVRPPRDQFYGERGGTVRDPFGHEWMIGHEIEKVTPEEMQRRYDELMKA